MDRVNGLISIVVPIYNTEEYLRKCINSIINQTFKNIEVVLVNDGSTDSCGKICEEYAARDNRIKVIHKENAGVSAARNSGIEICTGEYIGFVDSDDWIEKDMFEILYDTVNRNNSDISICNIYDDKRIDIEPYEVYTYDKDNFCIEMFTGNSFEGYLCNKLFKAELFEFVRLDEEIGIIEDLLLIYNILKSRNTISATYITKGLYHYIERENSALNGKFSKVSFSRLKAFEYLYNDSLKTYPTLSEYIFGRYIEENIYEAMRYIRSNCDEKSYLVQIRNNIAENYKKIKSSKYLNFKQKICIFLIKVNLRLFCSTYKVVNIFN